MPKLVEYAHPRNGSGRPEFFVRGCMPRHGYCTWQIGEQGLAYLGRSDGRSVSIRDIEYLLERKWIWTGGRGTHGPTESRLARWQTELATRLISWAGRGGEEELDAILSREQQRGACFSKPFLRWLRSLDPDAGLQRLERITISEFSDLCLDELGELPAPSLHSHWHECGAVQVVWRLSRVVGRVAATAEKDFREPPLFTWLRGELLASPPKIAVPRSHRWLPPRIIWDPEQQRVFVNLPAQRMPPDASTVQWSIARDPPQRLVFRGGESQEIESRPIRVSEFPLAVELRTATPRSPSTFSLGGRWSFGRPLDVPWMLFHANGSLVDVDEPDPLPLGDYLLLVLADATKRIAKRKGMGDLCRVEIGPIGWPGWIGYRFVARAGLELDGYAFEEIAPRVTWTLPDGDGSVRWLHRHPVHLGRWPLIRVECGTPLHHGIVEVSFGSVPDPAPIRIRIGPLAADNDGAYTLDLNTQGALAHRWGRVELRARWGERGKSVPPLAFSRLPAMQVSYFPDERDNYRSLGLRVKLPSPASPLIPYGEQTEMAEDENGSLQFRSRGPISEPSVEFGDPASGWWGQVGIAATRVRRVAANGECTDWQSPPLQIDLSKVSLDHRLQIEFAEFPETDGDRLDCRFDNGAIRSFGKAGQDRVRFVIDLHRWRDCHDWRDEDGRFQAGSVSVRGRRGWIGMADLVGQPPPPSVPAPPPDPWMIEAVALRKALQAGDVSAIQHSVVQCRSLMAGLSVGVREQLQLTLAEAVFSTSSCVTTLQEVSLSLTHPGSEGGLPEAGYLQTALNLRRGILGAPATYGTSKHFDQFRVMPEGSRFAKIVRSLAWYRYARVERSSSVPWLTVLAECLAHREHHRGQNALLDQDISILYELSLLVRGESPTVADDGPGESVWIEAVRFANRFLRGVWYGQEIDDTPPLEGAEPPWFMHPVDVEFLRFTVRLASSDPTVPWPDILRSWESLPDLGLPLIRARWVRYSGSGGVATQEYQKAYLSANQSRCDWLTGVVINEM